jgi:hypothetical protein
MRREHKERAGFARARSPAKRRPRKRGKGAQRAFRGSGVPENAERARSALSGEGPRPPLQPFSAMRLVGILVAECLAVVRIP